MPAKGQHLSNEARRKISESKIGKPRSEETRQKLSKALTGRFVGENNPFYGKHHTDETKKKISENHKEAYASGKIHPMKGKHFSEEQKRKMSETLKEGYRTGKHTPPNYWKGKKFSEDHKRHISEGGKGRIVSKETRQKLSELRTGYKNPSWKGDDVTCHSLHDWVRWHKPRVALCEICGEKPPRDLANISGEYKRDINDYQWLCRKCHMVSDNRLKLLAIRNKSEESRKNLSIKKTGKKLWDTRTHPWIGRHHSEETKKKISDTKRNKAI
jgi:hypothetical protein